MSSGWTIRHVDVCHRTSPRGEHVRSGDVDAAARNPKGLTPRSSSLADRRVPREHGLRGVFAVFWDGVVPLGHAWVAGDDAEIDDSIDEFAKRLRHEGGARTFAMHKHAPVDHPIAAVPSLSVVIPTRGRAASLRRCLDSLGRLDDPPLEIVVVDNSDGDPDTRRTVAQFAGVRLLVEPRPGASRARNSGARATTADVVAFLDDDETVHTAWSTSLRRALQNPDVALVTGLVLPASLDTEAQIVFERRFSFIRGYAPRTVGPDDAAAGFATWRLGGSGNMAVRKETFERLGGFDVRLGAGAAGCSEDTDFFQRVLESGRHCLYEPRAVVFHMHRTDFTALRRQAFEYMRGHVATLVLTWRERRDRHSLRRLTLSLPRYYAASFVRLLQRRKGLHAGVFLSELAGCLSGLGASLWQRGTNRALSPSHGDVRRSIVLNSDL